MATPNWAKMSLLGEDVTEVLFDHSFRDLVNRSDVSVGITGHDGANELDLRVSSARPFFDAPLQW